MASKRMFANTVIDSDRFLDLPPMAQLLYFHLGLKVDDDGFVSGAKRIARIIGTTDRDFQALIENGFLLEFPERKVFVVVHHRVNNDLKNDRYHATIYQDEYEKLELTQNKEYKLKQNGSELETKRIQTVSNQETEQSLTKPSVTEPSVTEPSVTQPSAGEESGEGGTKFLVLETCRLQGLNPQVIQPLIEKFGSEKIHDALLKWKASGEEPKEFESLIEKGE